MYKIKINLLPVSLLLSSDYLYVIRLACNGLPSVIINVANIFSSLIIVLIKNICLDTCITPYLPSCDFSDGEHSPSDMAHGPKTEFRTLLVHCCYKTKLKWLGSEVIIMIFL